MTERPREWRGQAVGMEGAGRGDDEGRPREGGTGFS